MKVLITGSGGLIGSEAAAYFAANGAQVIGIDNDMRSYFFGADASTRRNIGRLTEKLGARYIHYDVDVRNLPALRQIFKDHSRGCGAIIHTAAQPSHDWAAREPQTDFAINANGTLNLLELAREHCPETPFLLTSTNKVYGDTPNGLPLVELERRFELEETHSYYDGIPETMPIDQSMHSIFGVSKLAADILTQEYGRYFGMPTACFRGGCLTGPNHSGTQLHGFLSYLMKCAVTHRPYSVLGYKGKQVRDNIHSYDLVRMFDEFIRSPRRGEVYNAGGSRLSHCSVLEAIDLCGEITGQAVEWRYVEKHRAGDHKWWISDIRKFRGHYPKWNITLRAKDILEEIYKKNRDRWWQEVA